MAKGWISRKFMRNRAKWGAPVSEEKRKAPLRKIISIIRHRSGMFEADYVMLECGHEGYAWGDLRARCTQCLASGDG